MSPIPIVSLSAAYPHNTNMRNPSGQHVNSGTTGAEGMKSAGNKAQQPMVRESFATGTNSTKRHTTSGKKPARGEPQKGHSDTT